MRDQSTDPLEQAAHEAEVILERLAAAASFETSPRPATNGQSRNQAPAPVAPADPLPGWSEQSFRDLLEALPDAVVVIDEAGTIVLLNHQAEHLFGYSRAELLGQLIEVLVPERLHDVHVGYRAGYFAAPRVRPLGGRGVRLAGRRKDGSEVPVEISLSPLRTPAGLLVISVIRDVSARQREEAKFRTLVENIPAVTFNAPLDGSVSELYVSPQIEQLLGFSQKEWLDDPVLWHRQLHPEDQERWNLQFAPVCAEGAPFKSVYRFVGKDGRVVWVQGSANLVRDDEGNLLFLQGVAFDVTSIKEAEEALREQASLAGLRAAVSASCTRGEQLPDLLRGCAAALAEHLGAGVGIWACLPGHHTLALQASAGPWPPPGEPARVSEVLAAVSATRQARHVPAAEGTGTLAGYPLLIESHLVGVLTLAASKPFNPATLQTLDLVADQLSLGIERKQAEDALLRANAELDARVQERTEELARSMAELTQKTEELKEFAYSATHDLNAPLFTMGVNTARLAKLTAGQLSEDAAKRITRLMEGLASLDSLIKKLSEFARVIEPKAPGPVDCGQAVAEALAAALQAAIDSSGAEITVGELPTVTGVGAFLMLLFQNLLGNAIKYRAPQRPPRIEVGSQRHGEGWLFWVRDNGLGIEDRFFEKIFKLGPEGRLHKQSEIEGCGYGLHICRKIVARHGGRIWVASEFGRGSTFYFTLAAEVVLARTA